MSKKCELIEPKGVLNSISYKGDSAGCGYIRIVEPYDLISSWIYKKLTFNFIHTPVFIDSINYYKNISFVKFQRSATKEHLNLFKWFNQNIQEQTNTGLVYESDDNLLNIPGRILSHGFILPGTLFFTISIKYLSQFTFILSFFNSILI